MEKFRNIKVCGHRRSGTHFICALVSINFLDNYEYQKIYEKHKMPSKLNVKDNLDTLFLYVGRDFDEVARSIFKMRKRFGLDENNFNKFLDKRYCDMYNGNLNVKVKVDNFKKSKVVTKVGGGLKNIKMTPYEYGLYDYSLGKDINTNNVMMVKYNNFVGDFQNSMLKIARKLGSKKTEFINVDKKIGGIPLK